MASGYPVARNAVIAGLLIALAAALGLLWQAKRATADAENRLGLDSSRVVGATFRAARALKVYTVGGSILARTTDDGFMGVLPSSQKTTLPFTVDYFVDFANLQSNAYHWNAKARRLIVDLPDVAPAPPNLDAAQETATQSGVFITRGAGLRLGKATAMVATARAHEFAARPGNLDKARASARTAVAEMTAAPLAAAGLRGVTVAVRFPFEPRPSTERWNAWTPLSEVLKH